MPAKQFRSASLLSVCRTNEHRAQRRLRLERARSRSQHAADDGKSLRRLQHTQAHARHAVHEAVHPRRHAAAAPGAPLHAASSAPRCLDVTV